MKDLKRLEICDSITQNQQLQIMNYKGIRIKTNNIVNLQEDKIKRIEKQNKGLILKLKISKKLTLVGVPTSIITGLVAGYLLAK
jgi:hypothetical protein